MAEEVALTQVRVDEGHLAWRKGQGRRVQGQGQQVQGHGMVNWKISHKNTQRPAYRGNGGRDRRGSRMMR